MTFLHIIYAYLVGGVTFIPLLIAVFIYLHPLQKETFPEEKLKAGEIEEANQTGLDAYKQGWIVVTHEHLESPDHISSSAQSVAESQEGKSAYSSLYKLVKNSNPNSKDGIAPEGETLESAPIPTNVPTKNKKHRYFAVLKHGNLFLYKNETLKDVKHVIVLTNYIVSLWPRSLTEGLLFTKYSAIAILRKDWSRKRRLSDNVGAAPDVELEHEHEITIHDVINPKSGLPAPSGLFFVYTEFSIDKEDWYFALIRASKSDGEISSRLDPKIHAKTLHFETEHMVNLILTLYSSEGQLHTKWLNALLGRVFLSLQKTDTMQNYLVSKIEKKLNKIKTPGFLDKFQITKVRAGHAAPFISFPVLKEINPEGELLVSVYLHYFGEMSIQLATKVNINLGSRFKPREMDVLLSMTLEKLQGPLLLKIKPPPSTRLWYTFEYEPAMLVKIEPVISSRQLSYNIITNSIEKKLKEAVKESVVLPHWDDFVFYETSDELYRGGVWDKKARDTKAPSNEGKAPDVPDDLLSVLTMEDDDSISTKSENIDVSLDPSSPDKHLKPSISNTLNEFSRRLRKGKSAHTLGVDDTNCLSDGSMVKSPNKLNETSTIADNTLTPDGKATTFRKLGKWYYKDKEDLASVSSGASAATAPAVYNPPEMIVNRRARKQSTSTLNSDVGKAHEDSNGFSYDFGSGKYTDLLAKGIDQPVSHHVPPKHSTVAPPMMAHAEVVIPAETPAAKLSSISASAPSVPSPPPELPPRDESNLVLLNDLELSKPAGLDEIDEKVSREITTGFDADLLLHRSETTLHRKPPPPGPIPLLPQS